MRRFLERLPDHARWILPGFCLVLVAMNWGRLDEWGSDGFRVYLTQAIMQTTLVDFAVVLLVVSHFVHMDAKKHGLTWWWIVPTYPFMPGIGLLAYLIVRQARLGRSESPAPR